MSDALVVEIARLEDGDALRRILEVAADPRCKMLDELRINFFAGGEKICPRSAFDSDEQLRGLLKNKGRTLRSISLRVTGQTKGVTYSRSIISSSNKHQAPSTLFDWLDINPGEHNQNPLAQIDFADFSDAVQNHFRVVSSRDMGELLGPDVQKHFVAREEALTRLENLAARILEESNEQRNKFDQEYLVRVQELEAKHVEMQKELEEHSRLRGIALDERETAIDLKAKAMDDRSSTHVRRELREKLKEALKNDTRMRFTRETGNRRWAVLVGFTVILLFTGIPAIALFIGEQQSNWNPWNFGRQTLLSISFVLTAGFFVRWLNTWATKSADEEYRLKQLEIDIDRASWLVELLFESRRDKGEELPAEVIQRFSRNLFQTHDSLEESVSAADALASALMTSAAQVKLKLPMDMGEMSIDGKGLRSLGKKQIDRDPA